MARVPDTDMAGRDHGLVGRDTELGQLMRSLDMGVPSNRVLVLLGAPGLGKTALATAAMDEARRNGMRVLNAAGLQSEAELPFAGLHQLLWPALDALDRLPTRQAEALRTAFGMGTAGGVDRFLVGLATLSLLAEVAETGPLLVVLDDAHTIDPASIDAVAFAVRRLQAERISVLVTSRTEDAVGAFDLADRLDLAPLSAGAAASLLDAQPPLGDADLRERVLHEADGNPLALIELTTAIRASGLPAPDSPVDVLPTTRRLELAFAERLRQLPDPARRLLTIASASDDRDLRLVLRVAAAEGLDPDGFRLAEDAGLVFVQGDTFTCRHPIVRSVIYQSAPAAERRSAHLALAGALVHEPDRRAWHLAAVAHAPDESVAAALEATAGAAAARGGYAAATRALRRAADLSADPDARSRRLVAAIEMAFDAGRSADVEELGGRVEREGTSARDRARARLAVAHVRAVTGRGMASNAVSLDEMRQTITAVPDVGIAMVALGAGIAFSTGDDALRVGTAEIIRAIPGSGVEPWRCYALAACDPVANARAIEPHVGDLRAATAKDVGLRRSVAMMLFHLDQTALAWDQLSTSIDETRAQARLNHLPVQLVILGLTAVSRGRWHEARSFTTEAISLATEMRQALMVGTGHAVGALLDALMGERASVLERARAATSTAEEAFVAALAAWARGLDALGAGQGEDARAALWPIYDPGGPAAHFAVARWAIADLAQAVAYGADAAGIEALVARAEEEAARGTSVRDLLVARRARALLAPSGHGTPLFEAAAAVDGADEWPFELARTRLAYGERLRRERQMIAARARLRAALQTFDALGAVPWAERARSELRAAGVTTEAPQPRTADELTPQQRQIVRLAARGLTNREIAEQLFLSPRTVSFHLYLAYPKLGVSSRAQLAPLFQSGGAPDV